MILDDFQLGELIARGGMSEVFEAHHLKLDVRAAAKILAPDSRKTSGVGESVGHRLLLNEARAHAQLRHPKIVELYDCGQTNEPHPRPFLVLERADANLAERLPLESFEAVAAVVESILEALMYAHARGIVHRDIKPENILVFDQGSHRFKLSDFGVALDTRPGAVDDSIRGTPLYMAPEQIAGHWRRCGPWTDVYSVGVVAWELVTGQPPFQAEGLSEMARLKAESEPPQFESLFDVPASLEVWLRRMMSRSIRGRYAMAADAMRGFLEAIEDPEVTRQSGEFTGIDREALDAAQTLLDAPPLLSESSIAQDSAEVLVYDPPNLPSNWRSQRTSRAKSIGLGLFALRPLPLVGFDAERDTLWGLLRSVIQGEGVKSAWIRQTQTDDAIALGDWFRHRVVETGAAQVMHLTYTRDHGALNGFSGALSRMFSASGLSRESLRSHLAERLGWLRPDARGEADLRVLTREIQSGDRGAISDINRHRVLARLCVQMCRERPLVVFVDNAQWGLDALNFLEMMQRTLPHLPILFVGCVDLDRIHDGAIEEQALERLWRNEAATCLDMDELSPATHLARIEAMLRLEEGLAHEIAEATHPDITWAALMITDLIESDSLEATESGYGLKAGVELPAELDVLIASRISTLPNEEATRALELAATLGYEPTVVEINAALELAGINLEPEEIQRFSDAGLVELGPDVWRFTHDSLVEWLRRRAESVGRTRENHRICADLLTQMPLVTDQPFTHALRLGTHALEADTPELGIELLADVVSKSCRGMPELASQCLALRQALLERAGHTEDSRYGVEQLVFESKLAEATGRVEDCADLALKAAGLAFENEYTRELAMAVKQLARVALDEGRWDDAIEHLERAAALFMEVDDPEGYAGTLMNLGWVMTRTSRCETGVDFFRKARAIYEGSESRLVADARVFEAIAHIALDELEIARELTTEALDDIRESRDLTMLPEVINNLAEIARFEGDWEAAHRYIQAAGWWRSLTQHRYVHVDDLNRALVAIGVSRFGEARALLEGLDERFIDSGFLMRLGLVYAAQSVTELGWGDRAQARARLNLLDAFVGVHGVHHRDIAWSCERGYRLAQQYDDQDLASRYYEHAVVQYRSLGLDTRAENLKTQ